ncbi:MAG: DJ-1/PfpI/YhbO family deglycase/protease [Actinomycetota bacterium]|nr:DJ-1/PfpI/YhbO family deglycase/protease [Actinomycetota bacterium]MDD5668354.1 DJ-1/PfpI/YhbO family deglycase/protease [Actinomycetota bacterium]
MDLEGKRVVVVIGKGFQDQEATVPIDFLAREGAEVVTVGPYTGDIEGIHGTVIKVDHVFADLDATAFDAMVVPGGRSPAYLREFKEARDFVASFAATGKPLAAICHGGQLLAAAGLVEGLTMTGYPKIREEMLEAGADFVDREVVVDRNVITSRVPDDLPAFNATLKEKLLGRA